MKVLELLNVYKSFRENEFVVCDACFDVEQGDFVVIIGPSGCGKTTILNMIAGLEEVTTGKIYINNKLSNNIDCKDRNIAMVFQNYALYPHLTVYENMAFSLRNKKVEKSTIERKISKTSALLKIDGLLNRKPSQLSGGQKQRVAIGRAIVRNPVMFLMDEPLSNLDSSLRNEMREELKKLHNEIEATIIYVTHDQIEALTLATKIIVMNDGVIQQIGTPIEVYNEPKNEFVACFLGTPKMNIFENVKYEIKDNELLIDLFGYKIEKKIANNLTIEGLDVGIRGENFEVVKGKGDGIKINIDYTELTGDYYLVYGNVSRYKNKIILKIKNDLFDEKDESIIVKPILKKIYLFDNKSKEKI